MTAISYLVEQFSKHYAIHQLEDEINKAKKMEKQQTKEAWCDGTYGVKYIENITLEYLKKNTTIKITIDKRNRLITGFFIYLISMLWLPVGYDLIPIIIIGTTKEIYDYISKKWNPEMNNLLFIIYGAFPAFLTKILIEYTSKLL